MRRKKANKVYSPEFKIMVIETMRSEALSYHETVRRFEMGDANVGSNRNSIKRWERIYLEEGVVGLMQERRGRGSKASGTVKGRPPKLDKAIEEDLIAENQRLRMENDYLKKLHALALSKIKLENETKQ